MSVKTLKEFQVYELKSLEGEVDSNEGFYADGNDLEERETLLMGEKRKEWWSP